VSEREPIFNVPGVVVVVLGLFAAMHLARTFLSYEADDRLIELLAFDPARLGGIPSNSVDGRAAAVMQFATHLFVHGDTTHLLINSAWFLAFATPVARRIGTARFLAFFLLCGTGGALLYYLLFNTALMVGASGAISGLMGAAIRFLFHPVSRGDADALAGDAGRAPLLSLRASLADRLILAAIAGWTLLNVLVALGAPYFLGERSIAWQAHLGGFFTGLLTFGLFDPKPPVHHDSAPAE
jgi:membrane associated rhomboid family serine protease